MRAIFPSSPPLPILKLNRDSHPVNTIVHRGENEGDLPFLSPTLYFNVFIIVIV